MLKGEFKQWWEKRRLSEITLDRKARQAGKDWKIQVAVVLERLPMVLPDKEDWEKDYDELYAYLAQFGKEYPKEFAPTNPPVKVAITDEELMGTYSFRTQETKHESISYFSMLKT